MSRIDELIAEHCPDGVEFKELGELLDYEQPGKYLVDSTAYDDSYTIPVLTAGQTFILGYTDETNGIYPASPENPVIIFDDFTTAFKWVDFPFKAKSSAMKMLTPKSNAMENLRYAYHLMQTISYVPQDHARQWIGTYSKFRVPIPPLEIQREIVKVLDTFTKLTAELTAELTARKKQYNYYRDQLLSFEEGAPLLTLSQCCESIADGDHQAPQKTENGIPFITISDVSATNKIDFSNTKFVSDSYYDGLAGKRKARINDILYTVVGSFGIPIHIASDKKFAFQRHIAILRPNQDVVISKYLYHALRSSYVIKQAHSVATGAAQKTITLSALNQMLIAVPPLGEQVRIVAILDKFDALTHSLTEGLPREIELRQKQYEYYRDLLLSFPKPVEAVA
jgi:type I restriction enzyme, S subunit